MSRDLLPTRSGDRRWSPDKWTSRHRYVVMLELCGLKNNEIAAATGYSESRISIILSDPRAEVDRTELAGGVADKVTDVGLKLQLHAHEALDELVDLMRDAPDDRVRQTSAIAILDRAGYSKYQGVQKDSVELGEEAAARLERSIATIEEAYPEADYEVVEDG